MLGYIVTLKAEDAVDVITKSKQLSSSLRVNVFPNEQMIP